MASFIAPAARRALVLAFVPLVVPALALSAARASPIVLRTVVRPGIVTAPVAPALPLITIPRLLLTIPLLMTIARLLLIAAIRLLVLVLPIALSEGHCREQQDHRRRHKKLLHECHPLCR